MAEPTSLLSPDRMDEETFLQLLLRHLSSEQYRRITVRTLHLDIVLSEDPP
jgi:hypothetical protein